MLCRNLSRRQPTLPARLLRATRLIGTSSALLALLAACGDDAGGAAEDSQADDAGSDGDLATDQAVERDVDAERDGDPVPDATGDGDSEVDASGCPETAGAALPPAVEDLEGFEWIVLDGNADQLADLSRDVLSQAHQGLYGVYDLNTLEVYGANHFRFDSPVTVYGAQARWANLDEEAAPVELIVWPDFGSNGFNFDVDHPYGQYARCLESSDEGEWVTYAFDTPIELTEPGRIFAGYHRESVLRSRGVLVDTQPELMFEDYLAEDPSYLGAAQFPDYDDEFYYGGWAVSFYTWQVRLAVVRHDDLPAEAKQFVVDGGVRASSRVALGDYDNDGDDDLMTNGPRLLQNQGDGRFVDVTGEAIAGGTENRSGGGVWGDYDNDGCLDYFGQGTGFGSGEVLLHNECDGTFVDVTLDSLIDDTQDERDCDGDGEPEHSPTEGSAWIDVDGDGLLDLYLANYECSSDFDYYENYADRFFRNLGDGTFQDATREVGVPRAFQAGRGVTVADADRDGDTDLFVSNYRLDPNFYLDNSGDGTFFDAARLNGTRGVEVGGAFGHTIGSVFGDIDNDGDFDLVSANLAHPRFYHFSDLTMVLVNDGFNVFQDEAKARGILYRETHSNPVLFDADNDGDLDLFITCVYAGRDSDFYENDGLGHFTLKNYESGLVVQNGWGAAAGDLDNDGDVDLVAYDVFINSLRTDGGTSDGDAHWLQVRAVGVGGNTSAIGAVVEVEAGGRRQLRPVSGGSGTSSQDSLVQHFGLGAESRADRVIVQFPYGERVELTDVDADERVWVYSDGDWGTGWAPPRALGEAR